MKLIHKSNKIMIGVFLIFTFLGWTVNPTFSYVSIIALFLYLAVSNNNDNIYWIFFLIPNVRIFDNLEFLNYVNLLILLTGFIFFFRKFKLYVDDLITIFLLFSFEMLHCYLYIATDNMNIEFVGMITFIWNLFFFLFLIRNNHKLELKKMNYYLIIGILVSSVIKLATYGTDFINYFLNSKDRFAAFSGDPNYFSMYLLIGIAYLLFFSKRRTIDVICIIILSFFGIITSSKMFILCFFSICIIFIFQNMRYKKFILRYIPLFLIIVIITIVLLGDILYPLLEKVIDRFFISDVISFDLSRITTGRYNLVEYYFNLLSQDFNVFLLGLGINYNLILNQMVAHNTYFDVFISWGIPGGMIFIYKLVHNINKYIINRQFYYFISLIIMLIMILALSCLGADMFFYLLFLSIKPLMETENGKKDFSDDVYV